MYADLVREKAAPAILNLYPGGDGIYQDDGARIHRCPEALGAVNEIFPQRIHQDLQAPKMADFWPIENIWAILKQKIPTYLKIDQTCKNYKLQNFVARII